MKKMTKGLPTIRKKHKVRRHKRKNDKIKPKLHTANRNWNDCKFQLHYNKLEWVDPRSRILIKEPYSTSSKIHIEKNDRTAHWVEHSILK